MSEYYRKPIVKILMLKGKDGQSIKEITKAGTSGLTDTYEISLTDGTKKAFNVSNGKGIKSFAKTSTSGLVDTYTITYNDGTTYSFTVKNGEKGETGSISNLKIGGVNLLSGTKDFSGDWINKSEWNISAEKYNGFIVATNKTAFKGLTKCIEGKKGEVYTFSFYLKRNNQDESSILSAVDTDSINLKSGGASIANSRKNISATDEWKRYEHTFKLLSDGLFSPCIISPSYSCKYSVCGYKIERGTIATDWTPALEDIESEIASAKDILNKTYPVGSIYMSVNNTEPSTLFGGTWERLQGRFLIGAGTIEDTNSNEEYGTLGHGDPDFKDGETGGEYWHQLDISEMPEHTHGIKSNSTDGNGDWILQDHLSSVKLEDLNWQHSGRGISYTGGSNKHNNMPPYLAVYMWKRTA